MRIYSNRQLKTLPGLATRPTLARVREALFNIWQGELLGCRWLDLCAGSGSMGAEALCRGAAFVLGIEQSSQACRLIQQNWQQVVQPSQKFRVLRGDVTQRIKTLAGQQFDRIYFDPPYASDLYQPVLVAIAELQLLAPEGKMAVEHHRDRPPAEQSGALVAYRTRVYGSTALTFFRIQQRPSNSTAIDKSFSE